MHEVLVNGLEGLSLSRKSVVRLGQTKIMFVSGYMEFQNRVLHGNSMETVVCQNGEIPWNPLNILKKVRVGSEIIGTVR